MCDSVVIAPSFLERMISHAQSTFPVECCGVLGGKKSVVTSVYPLTNDLASPTQYFANPREMFQAARKMREKSENMIGIYHSHPQGPSTPSVTDQEQNYYPGLFYFIISLAEPEPVVRCFTMSEQGIFSPIQIV
ncbi:MAG: M67 family metallopeptidase [bacterium]